jgi:Domain of unknown function (DUF397)
MPTKKCDWFKSSYSGANGGCVETRHRIDGDMDVRDSKDPEGPSFTFSAAAWAAFVAEVKGGGFPVVG